MPLACAEESCHSGLEAALKAASLLRDSLLSCMGTQACRQPRLTIPLALLHPLILILQAKELIDYAFHRGIRILPEFDMPGAWVGGEVTRPT